MTSRATGDKRLTIRNISTDNDRVPAYRTPYVLNEVFTSYPSVARYKEENE